MSDLKEEFMAAAVRPIGNPEQKLGLWRWLGELMGEADDESLAQVTRRWDEIDARGARGNARKVVMVVLVLLTVLGTVPLLNTWHELKRNGALVGKAEWSEPAVLSIGKKLDTKGRLLLGDPAMPTLQQKQALLQSDPENPAFFAEYSVAHHQSHGRLPTDYLVTASRLDPDNGWFDYFAAATVAMKSVERIKLTSKEKKSGVAPRWDIKDPSRVAEALEILRAAKAKSRFQNYEETLLRQRIPLLSQTNSGERFASCSYLLGSLSHQINLRLLADVIAASAWQAGEKKDAKLYHEVSSDARNLLDSLSRLEDVTLLGELVHRVTMAVVSPNLRAAAGQLGLQDEVEYWGKMEDFVKRSDERRKEKSKAGGVSQLMRNQGDLFVSYSGPAVARLVGSPLPVTAEDLKAGRMSNVQFLAAMASRAGWLLMAGATVAVALCRFRASPALRLLAVRGAALWEKSDWVWMMGAVLVPMVVALVVSLFPPDGIWGIITGDDRREQILGQYLAVTLMLIILPVLIARWRFSVRARAFGFAGKSWMGWVAFACLILFVPCLPYYQDVRYGEKIAIGHLAIVGGWILITVGVALFGKSRGLLRRLMVARVILPMYLLSMIAMAVMSSLLLVSSQRWFEKDHFGRLTADAPAAMPYEYRVAKQLRKEIAEMKAAK